MAPDSCYCRNPDIHIDHACPPSMTETPTLLLPHDLGPDRHSQLRDVLEHDLPGGALQIATTPEETLEVAPQAAGIVAGSLSQDLLEAASTLEWVQALSAGVDHYDQAALRERDVVLTNASGVHAEPIAEQVLAYILMFERNLHRLADQQADRVWHRREGGEIRGKTMGIIGVGAIGTRTAELASALGMEVIGTKRTLEDAPDVLERCYPAEHYQEVCRQADYVVLACPLTDETEGLISRPELRLMSSDAVIVNIARGEVIDEAALTRAVQSNWIRGAALDVFETEPLPQESPLWTLPNVIITPHMAGSTPKKAARWGEIILENYRALAAGNRAEMTNRVW